jgi:hypothetical protein
MAWTQVEYETLKAAVASGQQEVRYSDKSVRYHSLSEMRSLLAQMEHEMAAASGSRGRELLRFKRD